MGNDIYRMTVLAKDDCAVSIHVQCNDPNVGVMNDVGFALMALLDGVPPKQPAPLSDEVSYDDLMDDAWASRYVRGFVTKAVVRDDRGSRWTLDVEVTDPAWIAHIEEGTAWDSRAFSPARIYASHPPIAPTPDAPMADAEGMFLWVPRECFANMDRRWTTLPALLETPTFAENHYMVGAPIPLETLRPGSPRFGRPVHVFWERDGDGLGVLAGVDESGELRIARMTGSSWGLGGHGVQRLCEVIPKAKRRPDERLTYPTVLRRADTTIAAVTCQGDRAVFTLRVPPDGRALPFKTETDALALLLEPAWVERDARLPDPKPPLLQALIADGVAREIEGAHRIQEILPLVARDYLTSFSVEPPPPPTGPALGSLTHAGAREALEAPWPSATVEVVVRDPRWLSHLHGIDPRVGVRDRPLPAPVEAAPQAEAPAPRPDDRVILWRSGRQNTLWMVERFGQTLRRHAGLRDSKQRQTSEASYASIEAATQQAEREITKKLKEGFERLPGGAEVQARVEATLGVTLAAPDPPRIATCVDPARDVDDNGRFRAGDIITGVGTMGTEFTQVFTLEELAAALLRSDRSTYVWSLRPATMSSTCVRVRLGPS